MLDDTFHPDDVVFKRAPLFGIPRKDLCDGTVALVQRKTAMFISFQGLEVRNLGDEINVGVYVSWGGQPSKRGFDWDKSAKLPFPGSRHESGCFPNEGRNRIPVEFDAPVSSIRLADDAEADELDPFSINHVFIARAARIGTSGMPQVMAEAKLNKKLESWAKQPAVETLIDEAKHVIATFEGLPAGRSRLEGITDKAAKTLAVQSFGSIGKKSRDSITFEEFVFLLVNFNVKLSLLQMARFWGAGVTDVKTNPNMSRDEFQLVLNMLSSVQQQMFLLPADVHYLFDPRRHVVDKANHRPGMLNALSLYCLLAAIGHPKSQKKVLSMFPGSGGDKSMVMTPEQFHQVWLSVVSVKQELRKTGADTSATDPTLLNAVIMREMKRRAVEFENAQGMARAERKEARDAREAKAAEAAKTGLDEQKDRRREEADRHRQELLDEQKRLEEQRAYEERLQELLIMTKVAKDRRDVLYREAQKVERVKLRALQREQDSKDASRARVPLVETALETPFEFDGRAQSLPTNLTACDLSWNSLREVPAEIGSLKCLTSLNLSHNTLSLLPDAIGDLIKLETLDVSTNRLKRLPENIGKLCNLLFINMDRNRLTVLPDTVGGMSSLQSLTIQQNELQELPRMVGLMADLQTLNLSENYLTALPLDLAACGNLRRLNVSRNLLEGSPLPASVPALYSLEWLDLSRNRISSLKPEFGALRRLEELILCHNRFTSLPPCVCEVETLARLKVTNNKLTQLPAGIVKMKALESLDVGSNTLVILPRLERIKTLRHLSLYNNRLSKLPLSLAPLWREGGQLESFNVDRNPLASLPSKFAGRSVEGAEALPKRHVRRRRSTLVAEMIDGVRKETKRWDQEARDKELIMEAERAGQPKQWKGVGKFFETGFGEDPLAHRRRLREEERIEEAKKEAEKRAALEALQPKPAPAHPRRGRYRAGAGAGGEEPIPPVATTAAAAAAGAASAMDGRPSSRPDSAASSAAGSVRAGDDADGYRAGSAGRRRRRQAPLRGSTHRRQSVGGESVGDSNADTNDDAGSVSGSVGGSVAGSVTRGSRRRKKRVERRSKRRVPTRSVTSAGGTKPSPTPPPPPMKADVLVASPVVTPRTLGAAPPHLTPSPALGPTMKPNPLAAGLPSTPTPGGVATAAAAAAVGVNGTATPPVSPVKPVEVETGLVADGPNTAGAGEVTKPVGDASRDETPVLGVEETKADVVDPVGGGAAAAGGGPVDEAETKEGGPESPVPDDGDATKQKKERKAKTKKGKRRKKKKDKLKATVPLPPKEVKPGHPTAPDGSPPPTHNPYDADNRRRRFGDSPPKSPMRSRSTGSPQRPETSPVDGDRSDGGDSPRQAEDKARQAAAELRAVLEEDLLEDPLAQRIPGAFVRLRRSSMGPDLEIGPRLRALAKGLSTSTDGVLTVKEALRRRHIKRQLDGGLVTVQDALKAREMQRLMEGGSTALQAALGRRREERLRHTTMLAEGAGLVPTIQQQQPNPSPDKGLPPVGRGRHAKTPPRRIELEGSVSLPSVYGIVDGNMTLTPEADKPKPPKPKKHVYKEARSKGKRWVPKHLQKDVAVDEPPPPPGGAALPLPPPSATLARKVPEPDIVRQSDDALASMVAEAAATEAAKAEADADGGGGGGAGSRRRSQEVIPDPPAYNSGYTGGDAAEFVTVNYKIRPHMHAEWSASLDLHLNKGGTLEVFYLAVRKRIGEAEWDIAFQPLIEQFYFEAKREGAPQVYEYLGEEEEAAHEKIRARVKALRDERVAEVMKTYKRNVNAGQKRYNISQDELRRRIEVDKAKPRRTEKMTPEELKALQDKVDSIWEIQQRRQHLHEHARERRHKQDIRSVRRDWIWGQREERRKNQLALFQGKGLSGGGGVTKSGTES